MGNIPSSTGSEENRRKPEPEEDEEEEEERKRQKEKQLQRQGPRMEQIPFIPDFKANYISDKPEPREGPGVSFGEIERKRSRIQELNRALYGLPADVSFEDEKKEKKEQMIYPNVLSLLPGAETQTAGYVFIKRLDEGEDKMTVICCPNLFSVSIRQDGIYYVLNRSLNFHFFTFNEYPYLAIPLHESLNNLDIEKDMELLIDDLAYTYALSKTPEDLVVNGILYPYSSSIVKKTVICKSRIFVCIYCKDGQFELFEGLNFFVKINNLTKSPEEIEERFKELKKAHQEKKEKEKEKEKDKKDEEKKEDKDKDTDTETEEE